MSYLNPVRLHFAGRFQAAISTINNDPGHFNNRDFKPSYQLQQAGNTSATANGWFNPRGSGDWRLLSCKVTQAWSTTGAVTAPDPILGYLIADSDRAAPAKLVDLDSEQQMVSEIWGLEVRICDASGTTYLRGKFQPAAFFDIWGRAMGAGGAGDAAFGATYQSTLTDLEWGDVDGSQSLQQLRAASSDRLSIKFNMDGINMRPGTESFLTGRIVGTIGPALAGEPQQLVLGRQFLTDGQAGNLNFCVGVVDDARRKILLDLGNALPTATPGGPLADLGALSLGFPVPHPDGSTGYQRIDDVPYTTRGWYEQTAGVVELPAARTLTDAELQAVGMLPLLLRLTTAGGDAPAGAAESPLGVYLRADRFVYRLNPGEEAGVRLYATRFGEPYPDAAIMVLPDPSQLQDQPSRLSVALPPRAATPPEAIEFPYRIHTGADGTALLTIKAHDPKKPRDYIDGQVYGVRPMLEDAILSPFTAFQAYQFDASSFISLLVWDAFQPDEPPTWHGSMRPVFQQYANLYPVMQQFLDLADYESVSANRELLLFAFGLDEGDPNAMPVTRDLSPAKRRAIRRWLTETGPDGKPLKGVTPPVTPAVEATPPAQPASPDMPELAPGGKADALRRRSGLRYRLEQIVME